MRASVLSHLECLVLTSLRCDAREECYDACIYLHFVPLYARIFSFFELPITVMEKHNNVATPWCHVGFTRHDGEVVQVQQRRTHKGKTLERKVNRDGIPVEVTEL